MASGRNLPSVKSQQSVTQLDDDAQVLFRHILRGDAATIEVHAAQLGWTRTKAARYLAHLESLRLIHLTEDGLVRTGDPRLTLGRLLDVEEADLAERRQVLLGVRQSMETYEADYRRGMELGTTQMPAWQRIPASEVAEAIERLARTSEGVLRQVTSTLAHGPGHLERVRRLRAEVMTSGREQQSIFPLSVLEDPSWRDLAEPRAAAGERQRYLEEVPLDFIIFGDSGVLLSDDDEESSAPDMLLVHSQNVRSTFVALFEELWRRADPLHDGAAAAADMRVLELLGLGFKDEAIARHLGMGLRTVRRRVAALMDEHGVDTRFQLGLAVARRGLLD